MDEQRLQRIAKDVASVNQLALARIRAAVNVDPLGAAERYGLSLITAQRMGRLAHGSLHGFGALPVPLLYADTTNIETTFDDAERSLGQPPGRCAQFQGGTDPDLARLYLQTVREDAWRYDVTAAVRWSWPLRHIRRLVEFPVGGLLFVADALRLRMSDGPMILELLASVEAEPLDAVPFEIRLGVITTLGEMPVSATG